jgi:ATP/maltotriose-dependent transcriptional regulator MalT
VIEESANVTERAHAAIALLNHSIFSGHKPDPRLLERCRIDLAAADRELALELTAAEVVSGYVAAASAGPAAARVIELSRGVAGETPAEKLLLAALSFVLGVSGQASADYCAGLAAQALAGGELVREWPDVMNTTAAAQILLVGDELRLAQSAIGSGLQTAREQGSEIAFALWSATDCYRGWLQGELVEAEAAGRSALAAANDLAAARTFAMAYLTLVLADRGELDEAEALVGARDSGAEKSVIDVLALRARARLRLAQARFEEASETALELGELLRSHGNAAHPGMSWRHDAAIALTATGNKPRARQLIAEQWVDTKVWNTPRLIGITLAAEGVVEGGDRGIDLLRHAVDTLEGTPARLAYAEALLELGAMLRRKKQRSEARGVLRRALDIADRAGAGLITARAAEEIAATGARPRRIRLTGVESLTPSELRVARMAAGGMANREIAQALFVTHKTVESQLGAVYRKLDVASRSKLQEALAGG